MKILSHTGNMVEARVGMVCNFVYLNGEVEPLLSPATIEAISEEDGGKICADLEHGDWYAPCHFVMLFCPFAVGDGVIDPDGIKCTINEIKDTRCVCNYMNDDGNFEGSVAWNANVLLHASPDLRPAEGYEFNQRARAQG